MLEFALRYIRLGWPVVPLRGKLPLVEHGSKDATLDEAQVRAWWQKWPNANIGLATGSKFFVVDIDWKSGGEESWEDLRLRYGSVPDTIEQITGTGGRHILFALPDFDVHNSQAKLGPGIDVRGVGGYIVAAPSVHPETGKRYEWDGIDRLDKQTLAPAAEWLLCLLRQVPERGSAAAPLPAKISEGSRNDTLFRAGAKLRRYGWSEEEIFASLRVTNELRCTPPLDQDEVRRIAASASRYEPERKADVFRTNQVAEPELLLNAADFEAAVNDAIVRNDLVAAMRLAERVAGLPVVDQVAIKTKLRQHFRGDFKERDFDRILRQAKNGGAKPPEPPVKEGGTDDPDLLVYALTDSGNGERLAALYSAEIRFCPEMTKWLIWDGQRWAVDDLAVVTQKAKVMARKIAQQAARLPENGWRKEVERWARLSESQTGITAALKRASSEPGIAVRVSQLDQHPYLLNCRNGIIDLKTGKLGLHDRSLLITKLCHVDYDPQAKCPLFLHFLEWAMGGGNPDAEVPEATGRLVAFLQRGFGYSLTADVSEKVAFVLWGDGENGKTTLLSVFKRLLREYAAEISVDTLMASRMPDASLRADLAELRGARFVTTSEVEKDSRLSEGKLKYITAGMGDIQTCRKYENPITFPATHKLFMDCNDRPTVRGTDNAIWRRLKLIPFTASVPLEKRDTGLLDKLLEEKAGILAWSVRGCLQWMEDGLGEPTEVTQASVAWREHDDPLKEFLEDCCEPDSEAWVRSAELSDVYAWWCKRNREAHPLGRQHFAERLQSKGFRSSRSRRVDGRQTRTVEGLRIRDEILQQARADAPYRKPIEE